MVSEDLLGALLIVRFDCRRKTMLDLVSILLLLLSECGSCRPRNNAAKQEGINVSTAAKRMFPAVRMPVDSDQSHTPTASFDAIAAVPESCSDGKKTRQRLWPRRLIEYKRSFRNRIGGYLRPRNTAADAGNRGAKSPRSIAHHKPRGKPAASFLRSGCSQATL